jgi:hypothetical protein
MKCECESVGLIKAGYESWYDAETELPFVNHAPGKCECRNELKQYRCLDGKIRALCSCCCMFGDVPVSDSDASLAEDPKGLSGEAVAARAVGIAQ